MEEVINEKKCIQLYIDVILGELFMENNIKVHYTYQYSLDDTMTYFAQKNNASILSWGRTWFKY